MNSLIFVTVVLIFLILLLLTQKQRVSMQADLEGDGLSADIYWLKPMFRVHVQISDIGTIAVYFLKFRIYHNPIQKKKIPEWRKRLIHSADLSHIEIDAAYGLYSPLSTALTYGAVIFVQDWFPENIARFTQYPNFLAEKEYVQVFASGYLNLGQTIKNYLKNKKTCKEK